MGDLINSVDQSGAKYVVLYVTDPFASIHYPSHREIERFLAESASGNSSANSTFCDEVCQIKSSLLEGLFVVSSCLILVFSMCALYCHLVSICLLCPKSTKSEKLTSPFHLHGRLHG